MISLFCTVDNSFERVMKESTFIIFYILESEFQLFGF